MSGSDVEQIRDQKNKDMTIVKYRIENAISQKQSVVTEEVT